MHKPSHGIKPLTIYFLFCVVCYSLLFTACSESISKDDLPESREEDQFHPPSPGPQTPLVILLPSPTAEIHSKDEIPFPTVTPTCTNGLQFLEDLSIPDGTIVDPKSLIDKRWRVQNSGTCNWDSRYRLRLVFGSNEDGINEQALYPARGGTQAIIRVQFFAPGEPGSYHIAWQAYDPQGEPFGDQIYVEFIVTSP